MLILFIQKRLNYKQPHYLYYECDILYKSVTDSRATMNRIRVPTKLHHLK